MTLGHKAIPASDPEEQRLRVEWYKRRKLWGDEGFPSASNSKRSFDRIDETLTAYLWKRASDEVAADRRKHPKAKRNLPVGYETLGDGGRILP